MFQWDDLSPLRFHKLSDPVESELYHTWRILHTYRRTWGIHPHFWIYTSDTNLELKEILK